MFWWTSHYEARSIMEIRRVLRLSLVCGCLATAMLVMSGCGGDSEPAVEGAVPVTGTITLDGSPVTMASVMFVPTQGGTGQAMTATAITDASGKYELTTKSAKGAMPGSYRVVISQMTKDGQPMAPDFEKSPMTLITEGYRETLHTNYSDMAFSKLTANVPAGGGTVDFQLDANGTVPKQ